MCNLNFLGHLVTPEGILPLRDKVKAVEDYPRPYNHKQLRAFLGFVNYYHRFVHNMAHHLAPLYNLLKNSKSKSQVIDWNDEAVQAFQHSKKMLAEATALAFPSSNLPTQIVVDASDIAIGAVLQQKYEEVWRPIAFFSRKLDATQKKYSTFDRELLSAYKAIRHFHYLIEGVKFTLVTDHKPLISAFYSRSDQLLTRRARQLSFISEFTDDLQHVHGKDNMVADTLSRIEINNILFTQKNLDYAEIARAQRDDVFIQKLLKNSIPTNLKIEEIRLDNCNVPLICDVSTSQLRPIIPVSFKKKVFLKIHNLSHPGMKVTRRLIRERFVWNCMNKDITNWVRSCITCQKGKITRHNKSPFQRFTLPSERFAHVHVDIVGPLPQSHGHRYIFTAIDRFTRWFIAAPMKEVSAETTAEALLHGWIQFYGVPKTITSDRGSQFTGHVWKNVMNILGIKHVTTTSYHPQSNGIVEIAHRRLKDALRMQDNPVNWFENLPLVMLSIRTSFKEELECSPSDLVYGQSLRLPQEFSSATLANNLMNRSQLVTKLRDFVKNLQPPSPREHQGKFFIDKNLNNSKRVFIRNDHLQQPLSPRFSGPYDVVSRHEKYFIVSLDGKNKSVSIDRLKACREDFPPPLANPPVESNPSLVQETYRTRKGRVIRKPFRFRNNSL